MLWFVIVCDVLILVRREQQLRCGEGCTDILLSPVETVQRDLMEFARCHAGNRELKNHDEVHDDDVC